MRRVTLVVLAVIALVCVMSAATLAWGAEIPPPPYKTAEACLACHAVANSGPVLHTVDFEVAKVDRTVCNNCHWLSSHPAHNIGSDCASCHKSWPTTGPSIPWTSAVLTPYGSFNSAASATTTDVAALHAIHSKRGWAADVTSRRWGCGSCHAPASCNACHTDVPHDSHPLQNANPAPDAPYAAVATGAPVGASSFVAGDTFKFVSCAATACHQGIGNERITEDSAPSVSAVGTWTVQTPAEAGFTVLGGTALFSKSVGSSITVPFQGNQVSVWSFTGYYAGAAQIYVDGQYVTTKDFYETSIHPTNGIWMSGVLPSGTHTLRIVVVAGSRGGTSVYFDRIVARDVVAPTNTAPTCSSCHPEREAEHGYDAFDHVSDETSTVQAGLGGKTCGDCHAMDLKSAHAAVSVANPGGAPIKDCNVCHSVLPGNTVTAEGTINPDHTPSVPSRWNQTCEACHSASNPVVALDKHAGMASAHATASVPAAAKGCVGCHTAGDLAAIHTDATTTVTPGGPVLTSCNVCHNAVTTLTNDCTACHFTMDAHPGVDHTSAYDMRSCAGAACHKSVVAPAGGTGSTEDLVAIHGDFRVFACSECHSSANERVKDAIKTHDKDCDACHDNPGDHRSVHPGTPALVDASGPHYAYVTGSAPGGTYTSDCSSVGCHTSNLVDEHLGATDAAGNVVRSPRFAPDGAPLGCATCHQSGDIRVQAAILSGSAPMHDYAACDACHTNAEGTGPVHRGIVPVHQSGYLGGTGQGLGNLATIHSGSMSVTPPGGQRISGCSLCHEYFTKYDTPTDQMGSRTQAAISAGNAKCDACHTSTMIEGKHSTPDSAACRDCHTGAVTALHAKSNLGGCSVCHANPTRGDLTAGKTDSDCAQSGCHTSEGTDYHTNMTVAHKAPTNATCFGSGCHDASQDLRKVHELYVGTGAEFSQFDTTCQLCHGSGSRIDWTKPVSAGCVDTCHSMPNHAGMRAKHTETSASSSCQPCHGTDIVATHNAYSDLSNCGRCHSDKANWSKTVDCGTCHAAKFPPASNHYPEATHTADPFTAAYQGPTFQSGGEECAKCHSALMTDAHATTSTNGGTVDCVDCHTDASLGSKTVIAGGWPTKQCVSCHDYAGAASKTHATYGTVHVVAANGCAGSGSGCHDSLDLAALHARSQSGAAPKSASCYNADPTDPTSCHNVKDKRPLPFNAADSCGTGSGGCHTDKGAGTHGTHNLNVTGSDYNNATVSGCTNSGAGCHLAETRPTSGTSGLASYENPYHPDNGCAASACHTSASLATHGNPLTCQDCHDGTYVKAPNVKTLTALAGSGGHYNETTHTAAAADLAGTVDSGGTVSAACVDCHPNAPASGLKQLYAQHQNLDPAFGGTTCADCHSYNAAVSAVVKASWAGDRCAGCHNATAMPGKAQHATTAPTVLGASADGCGNSGTGCHNTYDLHELHKGRAGGKVSTCGLSGCHILGDPTKEGVKPTGKTCGTGGACHGTVTPATHGSHTLKLADSDYNDTTIAGCTNSGAGCHGSEMRPAPNYQAPYHPNTGCAAGACHTSAGFATHRNPLACQDCHDGTYAKAPNVKTLTALAGSGGHYDETTHTAAVADRTGTVGSGGTVTAKCTDCHNATPSSGLKQLYAQHQGLPAAFGSTTCSGCHNYNTAVAAVVNASWSNDRCADCHNATAMPGLAQHATTAPVVLATSADGCGGSGAGCHSVNDLHALHKGKAGGRVNTCALSGCHDYSKQGLKPTAKSCGTGGACHGTYASTHYTVALHTPKAADQTGTVTSGGTVKARCIDCHGAGTGSTAWLNTQHQSLPAPYGNTTCADCHNFSAGVTAEVSSSWPGKACADCHNTTDMPGLAQHATTAPAVTASTSGNCLGCHPSDLHALHKGKTGGKVTTCALSGCHDYTKEGLKPTGKTCGTGGVCHNSGDPHKPHVTTNSATCVQSGCHANDLMVLHKDRPEGACDVCHDNAGTDLTAGKTAFDCQQSGCHASIPTGDHKAAHNTSGTVDPGCGGCHFSNLVDEHSALGVVCDDCHRSTNAAVKSAIASGSVACAGCHPAVNGKDRHQNEDNNEFVPSNSSVHRVYGTLPSMRSSFVVSGKTYTWTLPSTTAFLKTGWTTTSVVTCDKCHTFASTASGPHGSSVQVNIDPAYTADYQTGRLGSSTANIICNKCHNTNYRSMNDVHNEGDHDGYYCVDCHTSLPHGWKLPRMLAYATDPAPYKSNKLTALSLENHNASSGWSESDCGANCEDHGGSISNKWPSAGQSIATINGTVMDSANATALAGAVVKLNTGATAITNKGGHYVFTNVGTGAYTVSVTATGFIGQSASVTVVNSTDYFADFNMLKLGTLGGVVTDSVTRLPLSGVTVSTNGVNRVTGADGKFDFGGLTAGVYSVTYTAAGYTGKTQSFTVAAGSATDASVAIVKIVNYTVTGKVTEAGTANGIVGATVSLGSGLTATTGSGGTYSIPNVTGGSYALAVSAPGYNPSSQAVTVGGGATTFDVALAKITNIAQGRTGTASRTGSGSSANNAFDGNTATYWDSGSTSSGGDWLQVDLGTAPAVYNKFVIDWNGSYYARSVTVQVSKDGSSWTNVASTSSGSGGSAQTFTTADGYNARYVRLSLSSAAQSSYRVDEFQIMPGGVLPSANVALDGTFSAQASNSSYPPSRAGDGTYSTYWQSNSLSSSSPSRWLQCDLGSAQAVQKIVVGWNTSSYYARSYQVQYASSASGPWTTVAGGDVTSGTSANKTITLATPVTARYWRVNCLTYNSSSGYRIYEFELWTP